MELRVLSEETITLSAETNHYKTEKLSMIDICQRNMYGNICFIFKNNGTSDFMSPNYIINGLKIALEEYPELAGSIEYRENASLLHYNNRGVKVITSEANFSYAEAEEVNFDMKKLPTTQIFPPEVQTCSFVLDYLLVTHLIYLNDKSIIIALSASHRICDTIGIFMFICAWAHAARNGNVGRFVNKTDRSLVVGNGKKAVSKLDRGYLAITTSLETPTLPPLVSHRFNVRFDQIESLKKEVLKDMENSFFLSNNDILTAVFWKALVQARMHNKMESTMLAMFANARKAFGLPNEYFGNGVTLLCERFNTEAFVKMSLVSIAWKIRELHKTLTNDFVIDLVNWLVDEKKSTNGFMPACNFNGDMFVSSMASIPFYNIDFGYGKLVHLMVPPLVLPGVMWVFPNSQKNGLHVEFSLEEDEMASFLNDDHVKKLVSIY